MKLELNFLEPAGYVFVVDAADKDFPGMCVISWYMLGSVGGIEGDCFGAIDEGTVNLYALISISFLCDWQWT